MEIVTLEHVNKEFGKLKVVEDFSLEIMDGEFISLIGPSGCGKTTVLRLIAGLDSPSSGRIIYNDGESRIGFVFQEPALFPWRSVKKNIEFPLEIRGIKDGRDGISRRYIDLVGLNGFENAYPHQLSGGMKHRASLARALAAEPRALLMDEPFAALDALLREQMQDELARIWEKEKKTIVFVTHSVEEALYLSDRIVLLTKRPSRIKRILKNPEPRNRDSMAAIELKKEIMVELRREMDVRN
jgi:NitT/TauT family transport system ATP-binding protein